MLEEFDLEGEAVTSLDLKCLLVSAGMQYPERVYDAVAGQARLEPPSNPFACNCLILPGEVSVHLHANAESSFGLDVDADNRVGLYHLGARLCDVSFPAPSDFSQQMTSAGNAFAGYAVLEGRGTLAFFYMWPCEYVKTNETCSFCFQVMAEQMGFPLPSPTPEEVAEIVGWAIEHAGVKEVQLTGGTKFVTRNECENYAAILRAVDERVGLDRIESEIYCYMTAPKNPADVDQVFAAGADRVAHDLHVWDSELHARHAPGHARKVGREAQLRALTHIAETYGPNKAFSAFVAGLEPLESMIEGAEWLASRGIVPAFSVWMPTPGSINADLQPPGIEYYRAARREFARLYQEYKLVPPGRAAGSHVSICHDIYRHMTPALPAPLLRSRLSGGVIV